MREYARPEVLANKIRLLRSSSPGMAFLIVEGGKDAAVYRGFSCPRRCSVQPSAGRDHAIDAATILSRDNVRDFIVIVDRDEWAFSGAVFDHHYLFCTDGRDLESTLLRAGIGIRVLNNYADSGIVRQIEKETRKAMLELVAEWAAVVGVLRWISMRNRLGLPTADVDIFSHVDQDTLVISVENVARDIVSKSVAPRHESIDASVEKLSKEARRMLSRTADVWLFCSGHDLCRTLLGGLVQEFGREMCKDLTFELLEAAIRAAYSWSDFQGTELYQDIKKWEVVNPPYRILADRPPP